MTLFKYSMKKAIKYILILITLLFMLLGFNSTVVKANALSIISEYSDVLDDLNSSENFDENNYTNLSYDDFMLLNNDNLTTNDLDVLNVINIYETDLNNLVIYIYQPMVNYVNLQATSINLSIECNEKNEFINYSNYKLELLNQNNVFSKYLVKDFKVENTDLRYYSITSIFRPFNKLIDNDIDNDNTIVEKANEVAQLWKVYDYENNTLYSYVNIDVVNITWQYLDFIRYVTATFPAKMGIDRYFIAFDTDRKIDDLISVDLSYRWAGDFTGAVGMVDDNGVYKGTITNDEIGDTISNVSIINFFSKKHDEQKWNRIQKSEDFIVENNDYLSDEQKNLFTKSQWVLNFVDIEFMDSFVGDIQYNIEEFYFLNFTFVSDGIVYTMGVIADNQIGDNSPLFETQLITDWFEKILMLVGILILIIILGYLSPIFSVVFKALVKCIQWSCKGLLLVISAPFKLIGSLFKTKKRKR